MYNFWIIVLCLGLQATKPIFGQADFNVKLLLPRYVERGSKATLQCRHDVRPEALFKVTWLKVDGGKFYEFINGRNPPFRNFSIAGGEIDWENSNESQVTLKNVDFELNGQFFCEVSTDLPIYTKPSSDELMSVIMSQTNPPVIKFRKRGPFVIGDRLLALCNTTRARPAPHITWLINGKKVDDKYVRTHHAPSPSKSRRTHQQPSVYTAQYYPQQPLMPHQQMPHYQQSANQYQQPPYVGPALYDRYDKSLLRWGGSRHYDDLLSQPSIQDGGLHYTVVNNPFSSLANMHDVYDDRIFDKKKHMEIKKRLEMKKLHEMKKQRNSANRKKRRHINENALGILRETLNSGGFGPQQQNHNGNSNNNVGPMSQLATNYQYPISHPGGGMGVAVAAAAVTAAQMEKGMYSLSQLSIELTEQFIGPNGRMELTCLSTIPSAIVEGEQYADYKTYSIKAELVRNESLYTTTSPPSIGMAALGNGVTYTAAAASHQLGWQSFVSLCGYLLICRMLISMGVLMQHNN